MKKCPMMLGVISATPYSYIDCIGDKCAALPRELWHDMDVDK